jgi:hypothetical protein
MEPMPHVMPDRALRSWWQTHRQQVGLVAFAIYLALLLLGTVGELFDVDWILKLPLWAP